MFTRIKSAPSSQGDAGAGRRKWPSLPPWLDHFNRRDLKELFRCWVAIWVASILIFIGPSLQSIGIATFFAALVLYIVPPTGIMFIYVLASLSLLFGMCLAWAWGLLTMKAALAARPASETQAQLAALQTQAALQAHQSGQSVTAEAQILVLNGYFLDARVTSVMYVLVCLFVYFMSRLRVANNKFALAQIFGIIVIDLTLCFAPVLYQMDNLLPKILVEPGAIGIGLGVACFVLIFPVSTSSAVLTHMEQLVRLSRVPLDYAKARLHQNPLELPELVKLNGNIIDGLKTIQPALSFLPLDVSRGRWGAAEIGGLWKVLRPMLVTSLALLDFLKGRVKGERKIEMFLDHSWGSADQPATEKGIPDIGRRQFEETAYLVDVLRSPEEAVLHNRTLAVLKEVNMPLLDVCVQAMDTIADSIHSANSGRWFFQPSAEQLENEVAKTEAALRDLQTARENYPDMTTELLCDRYSGISDPKHHAGVESHAGPYTFREVVLAMVVEDRVLEFAQTINDVLSHLVWLLRERQRRRLWIPSHLQQGISWLFNTHIDAPVDSSAGGVAKDPTTTEQETQEVHEFLRMSQRQGTRPRSRLSRWIAATCHWLTNEGGMYALRMVIVTIATAIPSALPHTAGFFYREKGIWAVITAQTTVIIYMADFTFALLSRLIGTVLGGVMAMVAWYIGSGSGPGNPYGLSTITAFMTLILIWWRLFLPSPLVPSAIMSGATFVLILGFSYDDTHTQQYGLPGYGYVAFWKRLVTVLLGFVAAAVVQLLPRPPSATRHVRRTLSNIIGTITDHYALILSRWARENGPNTDGKGYEKISLELAHQLLELNGPIALLRFEMSFGVFDRKALQQTQTLCEDMGQSLARLLNLSTSLPHVFQERLERKVGVLQERNIKSTMAVLSVIRQALKAGDPLPEQLPTPLVRQCYESWRLSSTEVEFDAALVRDPNYRKYCVAMGSYLRFLSAVDDLVLVLKGVLGESHIINRGEELEPLV